MFVCASLSFSKHCPFSFSLVQNQNSPHSYFTYRIWVVVEIAKTRLIVNPGFGFGFTAKPGFRV